ncbi:MAG TPA: hypothetical protein VMR66_06675 [Gemmatimonadota bacterium]|nr:hypothetical protein [Gemmatimonadota bacterium]
MSEIPQPSGQGAGRDATVGQEGGDERPDLDGLLGPGGGKGESQGREDRQP